MQKENVLLVPNQAIKRSGPNRVVEVVIGEGKTEERVVEIGSSDAMRTEILSGLEEGEKVLVESRAAQSLRQ
ncbi:MAG: efflux transporter periplasmic adaptor subunit, partial [Chloroflexi bacterium CG07_land_8_20_14_0_80_51_10]